MTWLIVLATFVALHAQNSTQGKEFWFTFMKNGYQFNGEEWVNNTVMISAKRACSGTIRRPNATSGGYDFTVEANSITTLEIPTYLAYNEGNEETIDNRSMVLHATDTVSVYICNIATFSFDASFVLPVESLGSEYIIQSDRQSQCNEVFPDQETSCFVVIAIDDNTVVDITPTVATLQHPAATTTTVTLSKGQTYFVRSNNLYGENHDLSGTTVFAREGKKIAVFNGNTLTCIPNESGNGHDHIFEQALPLESWGRRFAVTTSRDRFRDLVKVTSSANDNEVTRDGENIVTLNQGESYEFYLYDADGSCYLETTQPSMVYLYNTTGLDPEAPEGYYLGDPSMVWIPPLEQRIEEITFCTFNHANAPIDNHYVNIVVEQRDINKVFLDDTKINSHEFRPIQGNEDYFFVRKSISHDTHHLSCESGLMAHVYGFGEAKGYAYCVGANVINLRCMLYANGVSSQTYHNGLFVCKDKSVTFKVETNYPITNVNWDFGDGHQNSGETTSHSFSQVGDWTTTAYVQGYTYSDQHQVFDTLSMTIHVGEADYHNETHVLCDVDVFDYYGVEYDHSGHYERVGTNLYGCDSSYYLTLDLGFTPYFEIVGDHWPVGGSETHISLNEYAIHLDDQRCVVDTVLWTIDCDNWYVEPHGNGSTCTLYIFTFLQEPVTLHACAINRCDTVCEEFSIRTTYFEVNEQHDPPSMEEMEVYNLLGQRVQGFPDLPLGIYILLIRAQDTVRTRKVMLTR